MSFLRKQSLPRTRCGESSTLETNDHKNRSMEVVDSSKEFVKT
jgi:hypothetical protein